jgi:hypothetical protein
MLKYWGNRCVKDYRIWGGSSRVYKTFAQPLGFLKTLHRSLPPHVSKCDSWQLSLCGFHKFTMHAGCLYMILHDWTDGARWTISIPQLQTMSNEPSHPLHTESRSNASYHHEEPAVRGSFQTMFTPIFKTCLGNPRSPWSKQPCARALQ